MRTFFNFRDLGNLPTEDGRQTPENTFYRSGNWDTATEEEISFLKSLNIMHVFDYRDFNESNGPAKAYSKTRVKHNQHPTGVRNSKLLKLEKAGILRKLFATLSIKDFEETYAQLPFDNDGFKAMLDTVVRLETPILQHCFAGKDRAGVGTALLLSLLGVKREYIVKDYMKSIEFEKEFAHYAMVKLPKFIQKIVIKRAGALFSVAPSLINATFGAIEEKYADMDTYFEKEFGISKTEIEKVRDHYLIPRQPVDNNNRE